MARMLHAALATRLFFTAPQLIGRRPASRTILLFYSFPPTLLQLRRLQPACSSHFGLLVGHHNRLSWLLSPAHLLLLLPSTTTLALNHA